MTTDEQRVLERVQKLLNMEGRTPEETATYAEKAQELMLAYNLSEDRLTESGESGRRAQEKLVGGFYEFERDLWSRVAELNFCVYWSVWATVARERQDARTAAYVSEHAREFRRERQHRIVGRVVNITATRSMMDYLLSSIERITREWLDDNQTTGLRSRRAVSFREGAAHDIASRLWDRRQEQITEEETRRRAEADAGMATASSSTALTISSVRKSERDANMDHIYGEGWSARRAAAMARQAAAHREAEEAETRWAEANPEKAARQEAARLKRERNRRPRSTGRQEKERDWGAFSSGRRAGASISLDQQISRRDSRALPSS